MIIKDFENYKIDKNGRIENITTGRILKQEKTATGYFRVTLCKNGKTERFMSHRLVMQTFVPNPNNKPQVNHINGIKDDNRLSNLEWCTQSENMIHAYKFLDTMMNKTNTKPVIMFNNHFELRFDTISEASKYILNLKNKEVNRRNIKNTVSAICMVCKGKRKTFYDFKWKYDKTIPCQAS